MSYGIARGRDLPMTIARALLISLLLAFASGLLMFLSVWFGIVFVAAALAVMVFSWRLVDRLFRPEVWKARLVIRKDDQ